MQEFDRRSLWRLRPTGEETLPYVMSLCGTEWFFKGMTEQLNMREQGNGVSL